MFGSNASGSLAADVARDGPSRTQVDGDEVDADWLQLVKSNHDVYVRLSDKLSLDQIPTECSLMAVSNQFGLVIVGGNSDVKVFRLSDIHDLLDQAPKESVPVATPIHTLPLPARPVWIRLALNEERLVVSTLNGQGVHLFKLQDVLSGQTSPYHSFTSNIPSSLIDLLPNPAQTVDLSRHVTLLAKQGLVLADIVDNKLSDPLQGPFSSASWSAKGKQIVVGIPTGELVQYTPDGTLKAKIPAPPDLEQGQYYPSFVHWLENDVLVAGYARNDGEPGDALEVFVIQRTKTSIKFNKFFDLLDSLGPPGRSGTSRYLVNLKSWGDRTKYLTFMMSGLATEIGVLHATTDGKWEALILDEMARGVLPAAKKGVMDEDTSVLGFDVDLTVAKPVHRGIQGGVELSDLAPPPRLLAYNQEGLLISYNVQYPDAPEYPGKVVPGKISPPTTAASGGDDESMDVGSPGVKAFAPNATPASKPAFGSSPFGSTTPGETPSAPAVKSAFGQSAFGSTTPSSTPAPKSVFGTAPAAPSPAFGQSAFGQSAFGSPAANTITASKLAFGQSAFGSTTPAAESTKSAFGPSSAFGQSAFGQASKPSPSGFGPSAFGQSSKPAASSSAFGSPASSFAGFGAFAQKSTGTTAPAFGSSAFGQASSVASESKPQTSAFGSATPGAFATSAFGSSAFGQASASEKKPASTEAKSAFGGFGQPAKSTFAGFGPKAENKETPRSVFGQKPESKSAFAGFGTPKSDTSTPPPVSSDDFGLGGFASALDDPAKSVKSDQGVVNSPPGSPVLQGGQAQLVDDDDETPPGSPVPATATVPRPSAASLTAAPASSLSSFIRPATGFSGSTGGGFGAFGQKPSSPFGQKPSTSGTPAAFASPAPSSTLSTSSGFGQSAFGQSSKPGAPSASGSTAFGQSSKPVGFGQSSTPPAIKVGSVVGGFGAFANAGKATFGEVKASASGSIFGAGENKEKTELPPVKIESFPDSPSGSEAEEESPVKPEPAVMPPGYGATVPKESPAEVTAPKPAPFPSGYNVPTPKRESNKEDKEPEAKDTAKSVSLPEDDSDEVAPEEPPAKPEAAIFPPGFDVPALKETQTPANEAKPNPLPEHKPKTESVKPEPAILPPGSASPTPDTTSSEKKKSAESETAKLPAGYDIPLSPKSAPTVSSDDKNEIKTSPSAGSSSTRHSEDEPVIVEHEDAEPEPYDGSQDEEDYDDQGEEDDQEEYDDEAYDEEDGEEYDQDDNVNDDQDDYDEEDEQRYDEDQATEDEYSNEQEEPAGSSSVPSLLSRLGPAATMESTSATESPAKPVVSAFGGFGLSAKKDEEKKEGQPKSAFSGFGSLGKNDQSVFANSAFGGGFGSFGKKDEDVSPGLGSLDRKDKKDEEKKEVKPAFGGFGTFVQKEANTPASSGSATRATPFDFKTGHGAGPSPFAIAEPTLPAGSFPGSGPKTTESSAPAQPTVSSASTKSAVPASPVPPFSFATSKGLNQKSETPPLPAGDSASAPPVQPSAFDGFWQKPGETVALSSASAPSTLTFPAPARKPVPPPPAPKDDGRTMASILEAMINGLVIDIDHFKKVIEANASYHEALSVADFAPVTSSTIQEHDSLPFTSLKDIQPMVDDLESQLHAVTKQRNGVEVKLNNLGARVLKSDMKVNQADSIIKARHDPALAQAMAVKDLGPEQAKTQERLRKVVEKTEKQLADLQAEIAGLKKHVSKSDHSTSLPGLDRVQKAVRSVDSAIRDHTATLGDLGDRIASIQLSPPRNLRESTSMSSSRPFVPVSFTPPPEVVQAVEKSLCKKTALKARFANPKRVIRVTHPGVSKVDGVLSHGALADGPAIIDNASPLDGSLVKKKPGPQVPIAQGQSSTPAALPPAPAPSLGGFAGIKLSLDPGKIPPAAPGARRANASVRSHAPAAKFTGSSPGSGSTASPSMTFTPPPPTSGRSAPSGFFSLSDYSKQ